jgi:hypothetical protein
MPTLVLSPRYSDDSIVLWRAAVGRGWSVERPTTWRLDSSIPVADVVLYGEPLFVESICQQLDLKLCTPDPDWIVRLPRSFLRRSIRVDTLGSLRQGDFPCFVKPLEPKRFEAGICRRLEDLPTHVPESEPILASDVVRWAVEYRCFVADGAITTCSPYLRDGVVVDRGEGATAPDEEQHIASEFAKRVLCDAGVAVPDAFVLDVGKLNDGNWAVVEANPAWSSGIYGCDPGQVLHVLERASHRRERGGVDE